MSSFRFRIMAFSGINHGIDESVEQFVSANGFEDHFGGDLEGTPLFEGVQSLLDFAHDFGFEESLIIASDILVQVVVLLSIVKKAFVVKV